MQKGEVKQIMHEIQNSKLSLIHAILTSIGIPKSQFYPLLIALFVIGTFFAFLIKNNSVISLFYQIKSEKSNNLSKLIKEIDDIKKNNKATLSAQNIFKVAIGITPTIPEIEFIAYKIEDIKDIFNFKRLYSKLTFSEKEGIFLIEKRGRIKGLAFDVGYFLFAGLSMFLFILLLVAAHSMHGMVLLCITLLIITSIIDYFFIVWIGIDSSTNILIKKAIIREDKNVKSHDIASDVVFSMVSAAGFIIGVVLLLIISYLNTHGWL